MDITAINMVLHYQKQVLKDFKELTRNSDLKEGHLRLDMPDSFPDSQSELDEIAYSYLRALRDVVGEYRFLNAKAMFRKAYVNTAYGSYIESLAMRLSLHGGTFIHKESLDVLFITPTYEGFDYSLVPFGVQDGHIVLNIGDNSLTLWASNLEDLHDIVNSCKQDKKVSILEEATFYVDRLVKFNTAYTQVKADVKLFLERSTDFLTYLELDGFLKTPRL